MYNGGKIIVGLLIFCGLVISPFVFGIGHKAKPSPSLDTPVINAMDKKQCVESKVYMATTHMQILNNWRDAVVRDGNRLYTARDGRQYTMSLQNTCMRCHSNKAKFCDECHNYVAVKPYCWDCHLMPEQTAAKTAKGGL